MRFKTGRQLLGRRFQIPIQFVQALQIQALLLDKISAAQISGQDCQQCDLMAEHLSLLQMQRLDEWW